jgi:hypothetical protein
LQRSWRSALWLAPLIAGAGCGGDSTSPGARAEQATLGASHDNTLYASVQGTLSNGAGQHLFVGSNNLGEARRGLLRFDLAAAGVPVTATVDSVHLTLTMSRSESTDVSQVAIHRLLASWGEGSSRAAGEEGMGAPPTPGDATWTHRFFGGELWTVAGGAFATAASATVQVGQEAVYTWRSTAGMVADVQAWIQQPQSNFGWIVLGNETTRRTAKRFDSRSHTVPQARPSLAVFYKVP